MSKTAGHTATPWTVGTSRGGSSYVYAVGATQPLKPRIRLNKTATSEEAANARLIVTAVNSHASNLRKVEALRDALRRTLMVAQGYVEICKARGDAHAQADKVLEEAAGALALAEEQL